MIELNGKEARNTQSYREDKVWPRLTWVGKEPNMGYLTGYAM